MKMPIGERLLWLVVFLLALSIWSGYQAHDKRIKALEAKPKEQSVQAR